MITIDSKKGADHSAPFSFGSPCMGPPGSAKGRPQGRLCDEREDHGGDC